MCVGVGKASDRPMEFGEEQSSKKTQVPRKRISIIIQSQKLFSIAQVRDIRIPLRYPINILQAS